MLDMMMLAAWPCLMVKLSNFESPDFGVSGHLFLLSGSSYINGTVSRAWAVASAEYIVRFQPCQSAEVTSILTLVLTIVFAIGVVDDVEVGFVFSVDFGLLGSSIGVSSLLKYWWILVLMKVSSFQKT